MILECLHSDCGWKGTEDEALNVRGSLHCMDCGEKLVGWRERYELRKRPGRLLTREAKEELEEEIVKVLRNRRSRMGLKSKEIAELLPFEEKPGRIGWICGVWSDRIEKDPAFVHRSKKPHRWRLAGRE